MKGLQAATLGSAKAPKRKINALGDEYSESEAGEEPESLQEAGANDEDEIAFACLACEGETLEVKPPGLCCSDSQCKHQSVRMPAWTLVKDQQTILDSL